MSKALSIGIDLGTTYSCIGVWQNGKVDIIPNDIGERTTQSYVAFNDPGRLVGNAAKNQINCNPSNTVFYAKRLTGRKPEDKEVQEDIKSWPFKVTKNPKSDRPLINVRYQNEEKKFYDDEILVIALQKIKQTGNDFLGKEAKEANITFPSYFNYSQKLEIKDASIPGLDILRTINEPTATAIAYGFDKKFKDERNVLFFNLGGCNLGLCLLSLEDGLMDFSKSEQRMVILT